METFQQILELDDDEEHEYSRELAGAYFAQARTIFADMRKALYVFTKLYF
jgi:osomolarity two-component system, phosphorelay intermediate protein YPD1